MGSAASHDITRLLQALGGGEESALEKLLPLVYGELRRRARRYSAHERKGHTPQKAWLLREMARQREASPP